MDQKVSTSLHILGIVMHNDKRLHRCLFQVHEHSPNACRYGLPLQVMQSAEIVIDLVNRKYIKNMFEDGSVVDPPSTLLYVFTNQDLEKLRFLNEKYTFVKC